MGFAGNVKERAKLPGRTIKVLMRNQILNKYSKLYAWTPVDIVYAMSKGLHKFLILTIFEVCCKYIYISFY